VGRRRELIVSAVLAVVVVAGLWALLVRPKAGQAAAAQAQEREAAARAETLRGQISALEQARSEAPSLRARAHEAGDPFPAKPDLPDLTSALQKVAQQAGVDLLSIQPSSPVASAASPELAVLATTVSVSGGYFEIEDFLSRLENLVKSPDPASRIPPRSVLVRSVSLSGSSSGGGGTSGGTSGTATATTTGATTLTANIGLAVFQHAKAKAAAGTTTTTAGGR
jgi:Tfp pilus assembly protein PilO